MVLAEACPLLLGVQQLVAAVGKPHQQRSELGHEPELEAGTGQDAS